MSDARYDELVRVAGPVSRETFAKLTAFQATFEKWAARINLAAPSTLPELWSRHILDSAQLLPLAPNAMRFVDLGSGRWISRSRSCGAISRPGRGVDHAGRKQSEEGLFPSECHCGIAWSCCGEAHRGYCANCRGRRYRDSTRLGRHCPNFWVSPNRGFLQEQQRCFTKAGITGGKSKKAVTLGNSVW